MPKERAEIVTERGGLAAEDFVELRTYGYADRPAVLTFEGHTHPDRPYTHKRLTKHLGAAGWAAFRRATWELREEVEAGLDPDRPDADEVRRYVAETIPNFLRDQGWLAAVRAFVTGIQTGDPTDHAGAADALAAVRVAQACVRSRDEGRVVAMDEM
jgi:predicted dehydrogenase